MIKSKLVNILKVKEIIPFDEFMHICLHDEEYGYYKTINPFGTYGDFITAPEISQIFGEIIALWIADTWLKMGSPTTFNLIELGAGKGTLLADILRVLQKIPEIYAAANIHILEVNRALLKLQKENLNSHNKNITWYENVEDLPSDYPSIVYSNEFFDALPTKQYTLHNDIWYELCITLNKEDNLTYIYNKCSPFNINYELLTNLQKQIKVKPQENFIYEISNMANSIFAQLLEKIKKASGVIFTVDYAYNTLPGKNTIRGYKNHQLLGQKDLLENFTYTDITYNVNYINLNNLALQHKANVFKITNQKQFLEALGIKERTQNLIEIIKQQQIENLDIEIKMLQQALHILTNEKEMGEIFKILVVSYNMDELAYFEKLS